MGFAAGFSAGNSAVNNAVSNALAFKKLKQDKAAQELKYKKEINDTATKDNDNAQKGLLKLGTEYKKNFDSIDDAKLTIGEYNRKVTSMKSQHQNIKNYTDGIDKRENTYGVQKYNEGTINMAKGISDLVMPEQMFEADVIHAQGVKSDSKTTSIAIPESLREVYRSGGLRIAANGDLMSATLTDDAGFNEEGLQNTGIKGRTFALSADASKETSVFAKVTYKDGTVEEKTYTKQELNSLSKDATVEKVGKQFKPPKEGGSTKKFDNYTKSEQAKLTEAGYKTGDVIEKNVAKTYIDEDTSSATEGKTVKIVGEDGKPKLMKQADYFKAEDKPELYEKETTPNNMKLAWTEYQKNNKSEIPLHTFKKVHWDKENNRMYESTEQKVRNKAKLRSDVTKNSMEIVNGTSKYNPETAGENQAIIKELGYSKITKDTIDNFETSKDNLQSLKRLESSIKEGVKNGTFSENQWTDYAENVATKYTPASWGLLSKEDRLATVDRLATEGRIGAEVAAYLKENSGTAASAQEAIRTLNNMMGGGKTTSIDVRQGNLRKYIAEKEVKTKEYATKAFKMGYQHGAGDYLFGDAKAKKKTWKDFR